MNQLSSKIYEAFRKGLPSEDTKVSQLKQELDGLLPLSDEEKKGIESFEDAFEVRFVYNSNSIEGSTLTPGETALVLEGEFVPDRPGREYFAARGSADGMAYYKRALTEGMDFDEEFIKNLHERTALDWQPATRGIYRRHAVYLRGSDTVPANWLVIPVPMKDLISAYRQSALPALSKAVIFHVFFENIHPFADGNGRCGRLILNYMLEQAGYPPIAIKFIAKAAYLQGLEQWQLYDDSMPFLDLFYTSVMNELEAKISCIQETRGF